MGSVVQQSVGERFKKFHHGYAHTMKLHDEVSVGASSYTSASDWIDIENYKEIGITYSLNSAVANNALIQWSNDGVAIHGEDAESFPATNGRFRSGLVATKARYVRLLVRNGDTTSRRISSWFYLKK